MQKTTIIGVTGGIGCGMTTVSQMMAERGAILISGDGIAREIVQLGQPAYASVVNQFGALILNSDKSIDRKKLGQLVFTDRDKLKLLNKLVHPFWIKKIKEEIDKVKSNSGGKCAIVDAAILFETGLNLEMDKLIVVTAPIKIRRERIRLRDNMDECEIDLRINAQIPVPEKAKQADIVIENIGTMEQTRDKVNQLWDELIKEYRLCQ